ncbi:MAG: hypothetical protein QF662_09475, partial [Phycisphaerae bacterium]|nr:hypothetical protein [Phycisphaerae bacterium]
MAKNDSANDEPGRDAARQGNAPQDELRYPFKRTRTVVILCAASAVLLTLAFPPANLSTAAYLAPVPLLVAIVLARTTRAAVLSSLLAGAIFFAVNCYWVFLVTFVGGVAVLAYLSAYFAALGWGIRRIRSATRWPMA